MNRTRVRQPLFDPRRLALAAALACAGCPGPGDLDPSGVNPVSDAGSATTGAAESSSETTVDTAEAMSGSGTTSTMIDVSVTCGGLPAAAVGAAFEHAFVVDPPAASWTWSIDGLPTGVKFSPITGEASGIPEVAGEFELDVAVAGPDGDAMATCTLTVAEPLSFDMDALGRPCFGPGDDPGDYQVGGTGAPLFCTDQDNQGDGQIPNGVSVDPDSCVIAGEPDDVLGAWVWIVEIEQEGARVLTPYCVVETDEPGDAYTISGDHSGAVGNILEPAVQVFDPSVPLAFGGMGDPHVLVEGPCGAQSCSFGYTFRVGSSPFGGCGADDCFGLEPAQIVRDTDDNPIGFQHNIFALGTPPSENFTARPFVLPWTMHYCLSGVSADCQGAREIESNGNGALHFSVLMLPPDL